MTSAMLAVPLTMTHAEQVAITIDGEFEDWADVVASVIDNKGDGMGAVDFTRIWLADDDRILYRPTSAAQTSSTVDIYLFGLRQTVQVHDLDAPTELCIPRDAPIQWYTCLLVEMYQLVDRKQDCPE